MQRKGAMKEARLSKALLGITSFMAISAIGGGIGLIATNGLGMPVSDLSTSPFGSYVIPGIILLVIFGGTQTLAAIYLIKRHPKANLVTAIAGFGAIIWIFVEMYMTPIKHWLQIAVFVLAIAELSLVFLALKVLPPKG